MTCDDVLVCDACRRPITEIELAMIQWDADPEGCVTSLLLAHKGRCCDTGRPPPLSMELFWFASPGVALRRLTELAHDYHWTPAQLRRLTFIAWAVATTASPKCRARAQKWHEQRMEMGL